MKHSLSGVHAFTVDVEEWHHGIPVSDRVRASAKPGLEPTIGRLLQLLRAQKTRATFFVLGLVASKQSKLIRMIVDAGHELGCHGWGHRHLSCMTPDQFRSDTKASLDTLANCIGRPVRAYRAAYFSIPSRNHWALDILAELGICYDSSIRPCRWFGRTCRSELQPYVIRTSAGTIFELPFPFRRLMGFSVPLSGGAWFRLYPYWLTRANLVHASGNGQSSVFYTHPWEIDPKHQRVAFEWKTWIKHYYRLSGTEPNLRRLLEDVQFRCLSEVLEGTLGLHPQDRR
jgi:polysaccharide deacetylase family protein (PEP-CTERM system associated)